MSIGTPWLTWWGWVLFGWGLGLALWAGWIVVWEIRYAIRRRWKR